MDDGAQWEQMLCFRSFEKTIFDSSYNDFYSKRSVSLNTCFEKGHFWTFLAGF